MPCNAPHPVIYKLVRSVTMLGCHLFIFFFFYHVSYGLHSSFDDFEMLHIAPAQDVSLLSEHSNFCRALTTPLTHASEVCLESVLASVHLTLLSMCVRMKLSHLAMTSRVHVVNVSSAEKCQSCASSSKCNCESETEYSNAPQMTTKHHSLWCGTIIRQTVSVSLRNTSEKQTPLSKAMTQNNKRRKQYLLIHMKRVGRRLSSLATRLFALRG